MKKPYTQYTLKPIFDFGACCEFELSTRCIDHHGNVTTNTKTKAYYEKNTH